MSQLNVNKIEISITKPAIFVLSCLFKSDLEFFLYLVESGLIFEIDSGPKKFQIGSGMIFEKK